LVTLEGECNQSCQQYRSDNSIDPKLATKRFLIFRIELLILIDDLSAHRNPLLPTSQNRQGRIVGTESGEMRVSYFTLKTFVILMETIKDLYKKH